MSKPELGPEERVRLLRRIRRYRTTGRTPQDDVRDFQAAILWSADAYSFLQAYPVLDTDSFGASFVRAIRRAEAELSLDKVQATVADPDVS